MRIPCNYDENYPLYKLIGCWVWTLYLVQTNFISAYPTVGRTCLELLGLVQLPVKRLIKKYAVLKPIKNLQM